jgi:LPS export ABC transporter protein LptC
MRSRTLAWGLCAGLAACAPHAPPQASPPPAAASPAASPGATAVPIRIETHGGGGQYVTIVETIRGRKVYTIRALSGSLQRAATNDATGDLEQPHITFIDKSGSTTIADAPKATVAERTKTVVMTGGVHARTSAGSVLTCDTLTYNGATERFHGRGHVRLVSPSSGADTVSIEGDDIDGDVKLQDVKITRNSG